MSGARIIFPEFRDEQSDSRYPFADSSTLTANTGHVIPRDAFFDAVLYVINATAPIYIYSIAVTAQTVTITMGDKQKQNIATATYNSLSPPNDGIVLINDTYGRPAGMLLAKKESLAEMGSWEPTTHTFAKTATEFVSGVVIPAQEPGVRAIAVPALDTFIAGDIWLVGKEGVVLRMDTSPNNLNTIRVDIVGVPLFKRLPCVDEAGNPTSEFAEKTFLRTINGCAPDEFGNFTITPVAHSATDSTLRIYPENNALKIGVVGTKVI